MLSADTAKNFPEWLYVVCFKFFLLFLLRPFRQNASTAWETPVLLRVTYKTGIFSNPKSLYQPYFYFFTCPILFS
jgi:hypothetical protein